MYESKWQTKMRAVIMVIWYGGNWLRLGLIEEKNKKGE